MSQFDPLCGVVHLGVMLSKCLQQKKEDFDTATLPLPSHSPWSTPGLPYCTDDIQTYERTYVIHTCADRPLRMRMRHANGSFAHAQKQSWLLL